jgi:hypothetical protein
VRITRCTVTEGTISIPIPIAISIWRRSSPNQAFQSTLDSAPERSRYKAGHRMDGGCLWGRLDWGLTASIKVVPFEPHSAERL